MANRKNSGNSHAAQDRRLNTASWVPKKHPAETLDSAFFRRCRQIEHETLSRVAYKKSSMSMHLIPAGLLRKSYVNHYEKCFQKDTRYTLHP